MIVVVGSPIRKKAYYDLNSAAWFAITHKRAGWDAIRHYEIIAAGARSLTMYFLGLERCPLHTLQAPPKAIPSLAQSSNHARRGAKRHASQMPFAAAPTAYCNTLVTAAIARR